MSLSPAQARQVGRIGGLRRAALHDSVELARQGQAGLRARLLAEVDPDGQLDEQERERRLQAALRAHMLRLQLRSAKALRQRRLAATGTGRGQPGSTAGALHPPLDDRAGLFVGETAEAFFEMQFAVMRDPDRLDVARRVLSEAMERVIASRPHKEKT